MRACVLVFLAAAVLVACGKGRETQTPPSPPPVNQAVVITVSGDTVSWTGGKAIRILVKQGEREWLVEDRAGYDSPIVISEHCEGSKPDAKKPYTVTVETEYARVTKRFGDKT